MAGSIDSHEGVDRTEHVREEEPMPSTLSADAAEAIVSVGNAMTQTSHVTPEMLGIHEGMTANEAKLQASSFANGKVTDILRTTNALRELLNDPQRDVLLKFSTTAAGMRYQSEIDTLVLDLRRIERELSEVGRKYTDRFAENEYPYLPHTDLAEPLIYGNALWNFARMISYQIHKEAE